MDTVSDRIRTTVSDHYGRIAAAGPGCGGPAQRGCCGPAADPDQLAKAIGYDPEELARLLPEGANLGLSCGNPAAIAALRPGEAVLDLGSGAGFDLFLAAPKVGPAGQAIGVDMSPAMLTRARAALPAFRARTGLANVEFRLGEIEHLPVADASIDVVISNCVLNLSPDKPQVWREIARVLRPGGRVAISDVVLLRPLPEGVRAAVEAWVGCIAGASLRGELERDMAAAGLAGIRLEPRAEYVAALRAAGDSLYREVAAALEPGVDLAEVVTSMRIAAVRP